MSLLDDARKRINAIDEEMAKLFEQRMQAVEDVIRYKQAHQMKVLDTSREQYVIEHNTAFIQREEYRDSYIEFISEMMAISRNISDRSLTGILSVIPGQKEHFPILLLSGCFWITERKAMPPLKTYFMQ